MTARGCGAYARPDEPFRPAPPEVISHAVWLYPSGRTVAPVTPSGCTRRAVWLHPSRRLVAPPFSLGLRDVQGLFVKRGRSKAGAWVGFPERSWPRGLLGRKSLLLRDAIRFGGEEEAREQGRGRDVRTGRIGKDRPSRNRGALAGHFGQVGRRASDPKPLTVFPASGRRTPRVGARSLSRPSGCPPHPRNHSFRRSESFFPLVGRQEAFREPEKPPVIFQ